jgi:predicted DCC family thiol-disulfide oxidoreductase YuxK
MKIPVAVFPLTLFYDANCAVCALEMDHLRSRNTLEKLVFIDINAHDFDPTVHGVTFEAMNAEIHGLCADGTLLCGIEVLRLAYEGAGIGWVLQPTGWAPVRPAFDVAYRVFARHRRTISKVAAPLINGLRYWRAKKTLERMRQCQNGVCDVEPDQPR